MRSRHLLVLCCLLASAARAQDLNVISGVEVKDEGTTIVVAVKGSKPPNFTTFSMADPPRFVIDLSESRFQGVPEDVKVDDGVIAVVKNLSYGSGATSIARVMIAFTVDVDPPDVQTAGGDLLVRVAKPAGAGAAAVAQGTAAAPAAAPALSAAEKAAETEAEARARAEVETELKAMAAAEAQAQAQPPAAAPQPPPTAAEPQTQTQTQTQPPAAEAAEAAAPV